MITKLILLALAATHVSRAALIDVAAARRATTAPPVTAAAARIRGHASRASTDALVAEMRAVAADRGLEPVAQEWLLEAGVHALRGLPVTPAARALAEELAMRPPRLYVHVEPEHGNRAVPLYDVGAVARHAIRDWIRDAARTATAQALALGSPAALESRSLQDTSSRAMATRDGILDAWRSAKPAQLAGQRAAVVAALRSGRDADGIALEVARRLHDAELYSLTIGYAEPAVALAAVQSAAHELEPGAALGVLGKAADRGPIASAALLAIGRLAETDAAARQLLFDRLSDPVSGESAAAALARSGDPAVAEQLVARLATAKDEPTRRRLALALRLNGSAAARDALRRIVDTKQGSAELRREVAAWLARGR